MLLRDFIRESIESLSAFYPSDEARKLVLMLAQSRLGVKSYTHIIEPDTEVPREFVDTLQTDVRRMLAGEPVQYVLGEAEFCGRMFRVAPGVLIPRPETEMLALEALNHVHSGSSVLDLCTGSGCIAWTVSLEKPGCKVTAVDISDAALEVAESQPFGDSPRFIRADILDDPDQSVFGTYDVLLANPPYIMDSERTVMRKNVLGFEPELALFVPDSDPLVFYRAIAVWAGKLLVRGGFAMVEINEKLGAETLALFECAQLSDIRTVKDFFGKDRFIVFSK